MDGPVDLLVFITVLTFFLHPKFGGTYTLLSFLISVVLASAAIVPKSVFFILW